ncbi:MAG: OprO/OprP family phosphate-selective porin [Verrucomicrobia subdivision 3 bacterium]|nr:OprO/OprP family phosphate-selective porin [Limisphaerales bacterium]
MKPPSLLTGLIVIQVAFVTPDAADADERDDRIRALEKRVEQLEKLLLEREAKIAPPGEAPKPAEAPKPGPSLSIGASGFSMRSADTNFALRLRGLLDVDSHWYVDDGGISDNDTFLVRRARPILEGTIFRDFDFRFTPEFGGSSTTIRDAWLNYRYDDPLQLRIGKMKSPAGLERWQSVANTLMVERSLVSGLWPVRDLGLMLHGELWPGDESVTKALGASGLANYELGVFNGAADGRAAGNADFDDDKTVAGRLFFHPFLKSGLKPLGRLGVGVSASYGNAEGSAGLPDDRGYETEARQGFFSYLSGDGATPATVNVIADGSHWRVGPQGYWYCGRFGLLGEYAISSQRLQRQAGPVTLSRAEHDAWSVTASWLLTGEEASFRSTTPQENFDPHAGGWGAWQVVARYSYLDIDDDVFPSLADPAESATRAAGWAIGLNWYLNRNVRVSLDFNHTDFEGGESGSVTAQDEDAFLTRVQLAF